MALLEVNPNDLLAMGFIEYNPVALVGYYQLDLDDTFFLTIEKDNMVLTLNKVGQNKPISKLRHIDNTLQINELIWLLTGLRTSSMNAMIRRMKRLTKFNVRLQKVGDVETTEKVYEEPGAFADGFDVDDIISEFESGNITNIVTR